MWASDHEHAHAQPAQPRCLAHVHSHDVGQWLDGDAVAVRAGHHCAQPVMDHFGVAATTRASFSIYNTPADVDALVAAIETVRELFH